MTGFFFSETMILSIQKKLVFWAKKFLGGSSDSFFQKDTKKEFFWGKYKELFLWV